MVDYDCVLIKYANSLGNFLGLPYSGLLDLVFVVCRVVFCVSKNEAEILYPQSLLSCFYSQLVVY